MTTMTAHVAPATRQASTGLIAQAKSWVSLVRAFALRMGHNALSLIAQARTVATEWYARAIAYVPQPIMVGIGASVLATRAGYHRVVDGAAWALRKVGQGLGFLGRLAGRAITWVANRIVDVVGMFSEPAAVRVEEFFCSAISRMNRIARQTGYVAGYGLEVARMVLKSDTVTTATNIAAGLVVVGVIAAFVAPVFGASLAAVPVLGAFVGHGLAGSWAAFKMIALVTGIASAYEIVAETVIRKPEPAATIKAQAKDFVSKVKAAGDPDVSTFADVVPSAGDKAAEGKADAELAMAAVKTASDEQIEAAAQQTRREADAAFREAKAQHGSSQNKSHKRR